MVEEAPGRPRGICLALPEAVEQGGVVEHTFRVRDKIFAMFLNNHRGDGRVAMWRKAPAGAQDVLVGSRQYTGAFWPAGGMEVQTSPAPFLRRTLSVGGSSR